MTAAVASPFGVAFGPANNKNSDVLEKFFSGWESVFCAPRSMEALSKEVAEEPVLLDYVFEHVESFTCADESTLADDPFSTPLRNSGHEYNTHPGYQGFPEELEFSKGSSYEIKRENSLVVEGPNGVPAYLELEVPPENRIIARLGEEGDLLDYCFEHVESFVCAEDSSLDDGVKRRDFNGSSKGGSKGGSKSSRSPVPNTTNQHLYRRRNSPETSHPIPRVISTTREKKKRRRKKQNYYPDEEDNILLYYRPEKITSQ